jgi:hypothetical protein
LTIIVGNRIGSILSTCPFQMSSFLVVSSNTRKRKVLYEGLCVKAENIMTLVLRDVTPCRYLPLIKKALRHLSEYRNLSA